MDYALTTERLVLRPATAGDHRVLLAHWTLLDVRRFMFDGALLSAAEVADTIGDSVRDFAAGGYGIWLIHEHGHAEPAGTAGLRPLDDIGLEIFYSLAPGSWGRGYATSVAVVTRLGMTPFAVVPGVLGPMTRYRATA
jgi:ribosomal-protein-alanine N-acetyltransferase